MAIKLKKDGLEKEIGKCISGKIVCPDCEKQGGALEGQKMSAVGDDESRVFVRTAICSLKS